MAVRGGNGGVPLQDHGAGLISNQVRVSFNYQTVRGTLGEAPNHTAI